MSQAFYPPRMTPWVISLCRLAMPWLQKRVLNGLTIDIPESELAKLEPYKNERILILPNHPSAEDPYIPFELSTRLGLNFHYVIAREAFEWNHGLRGKLFQHVGGYSVIRGAPDRDSFKTTQEILLSGKNPLVIFIEGEISSANDILIPFESGVVQLALRAQETLAKNTETPPGLFLVPMAIRYHYNSDVAPALHRALVRLEKEVGLPPGKDTTPHFIRLRKIGDVVLRETERLMGLPSPNLEDLNETAWAELNQHQRIETVRDRMLLYMESYLNIPSPTFPPLEPRENDFQNRAQIFLDRVRAVRNTMDKRIHAYGEKPKQPSPYVRHMDDHVQGVYCSFYRDLKRLVNFFTLSEGYVHANMTLDRTAELLRRLELEVYGEPQFQHPRTATVRLAEPKDCRTYLDSFRQNKKETAHHVASALEACMVHLLYVGEEGYGSRV